MTKTPYINEAFYLVRPGSSNKRVIETEDFIDLTGHERFAAVQKVYVNAISRVEINEDSAKYFFSVKTRYYYSDTIDGVASEYSYFTLNNEDKPIFATTAGHCAVFKTFAEAHEYAYEMDENQRKIQSEQDIRLIENLEDVIKQIKGKKEIENEQ